VHRRRIESSQSRRLNGWRIAHALLGAFVFSAGITQASAEPIGPGNAQQIASIGGVDFPVFTYRPSGCEPRLLLLVFHGVGRNGGPYRNHARPLADRVCAIVVAPQFDQRRFPRDEYQYGGVKSASLASGASATSAVGRRTVDLIPEFVTWAREAAGQTELPYILLGHSAGAQFVDRVAAYAPVPAARVVVANPSTWVLPDTKTAIPFGFGGLGTDEVEERALRAYLAEPLTVLLGQDDVHQRWLAQGKQARAQGDNRYDRGTHAFHAAEEVARRNGWAFGWKLIEVPGVGHDAAAMFDSPQAVEALGLDGGG
jgi:pimeloyl-ACP methyl ester carboxylesterase